MELELFSMCVLILNYVHGTEATSGRLVMTFPHRVRTFAYYVAGRRCFRVGMNLFVVVRRLLGIMLDIQRVNN